MARCTRWWLMTMLALGAVTVTVEVAGAGDGGWRAGVSRVNITPNEPMWMSGYASRTKPAEGKRTDLWAKALLLEDPAGHRALLISLDLVGIDRELSAAIRDLLQSRFGLAPDQVALCTSHTHTGPVVGTNLRTMYFVDDEQNSLIDEYTKALPERLVELVNDAVDRLRPVQLAWGEGEATFAVNRRNNPEVDVPRLREADELAGPVDHAVPVLKVLDADAKLLAVAFGYACHATVLSDYLWSGDYPGYAMAALEAAHPGAVALFWAGCGADQNPLPRRSAELAENYGNQLAAAVDDVLAGEMNPLSGSLATRYVEIDLPFDKLPTREQLEAEAQSDNRYFASRAQMLLARLDAGQELAPTYPYPIVAWRLGPELQWIALGGEVVVDYALRLKSELGAERTWVAGYANDVMAYIPSRRVLTEGGYEGGGAMVYYGLPTAWAPQVEERIVRQVHELLQAPRGAAR